ncbi:hypothetical protein [Cryptosporangium arvum]|uniref:hypothetical protein n=1 Tax=Cryptosporangium arvum TaxID=80871 RepID=UPI0004AF9593|nr:hypothetical protein [Cryptosporangium arvum]
MGGSESRRRSRHSVAQTDPLYWARARAAAQDPFGRPVDRDAIDPDATTEEFPSIAPEWSGRLPLPAPVDLPVRRPWSGEDATTDSLPAIRTDDAATTVDLPAVPSDAETVDHRDRPLALVPRSYSSGRSSLARRGYTGRHRPPPAPSPTRLGLSTVGMTVAVGVLGVTLAMLHAQPNDQADRAAPPLSAVSPTGPPDAGGAEAAEPRPTPGPDGKLIPRPGATPSTGPAATSGASSPRVGRPAVAPGAPGADDGGSDDDSGDEGATTGEQPAAPATPRSGGRPTRTRQPGTVARPTPRTSPRCATGRTNALADDPSASTGAPTPADPDETSPESSEPTDEATEGTSPSAPAGAC